MSNIVNKVKSAVSGGEKHKDDHKEQSFSIQPHPAKTNDPADLTRNPFQGPGSGLNSQPEMQAHHARGPHIPSAEIANNLEQPAACCFNPWSREELRARAAELNK